MKNSFLLVLNIGLEEVCIINLVIKITVVKELVEAPKCACFRLEEKAENQVVFLFFVLVWEGQAYLELVIRV